jgi:FKBP-type peptidyl-prolyl cis-trans isomerase FkpA
MNQHFTGKTTCKQIIKNTLMKRLNYLFWIVAVLALTVACNKVSYRKAKSGLLYKIYPGNGKDSLMKEGNIVKFQVIAKLNDSVLFTNYGKLPQYAQLNSSPNAAYSIFEILPMMRKGDSAVTVQLVDTLLRKGAQLPPVAKRGDLITTSIFITEVFRIDSLAQADYNIENEKDKPRQMKEQEEQMAKMEKEKQEQQAKEDKQLEKSGEVAKEQQAIEAYLASKKINAQKTGKGTYVYIQEKGTGPQATAGKYVTVKYTGKILDTDSTFQSNAYSFQLGKSVVIRGWDEGLVLFQKGGKGTLYIPGFLAYGGNPTPGSPFKPFQALKFDVEMLEVSDTLLPQPAQPAQRPQKN